jgi:archaellum component FlaC
MAFLAVAIVVVRAMVRFEKAADDFSKTSEAVQRAMAQVQDITGEVHELVSSLADVAPHLQRIATRFEDLGERTARLSDAVLDEVEAPIKSAVAVAKGVRFGTKVLFDRLTRRFAHHPSQTNGGQSHA